MLKSILHTLEVYQKYHVHMKTFSVDQHGVNWLS